jgi:hypothetical protein
MIAGVQFWFLESVHAAIIPGSTRERFAWTAVAEAVQAAKEKLMGLHCPAGGERHRGQAAVARGRIDQGQPHGDVREHPGLQ